MGPPRRSSPQRTKNTDRPNYATPRPIAGTCNGASAEKGPAPVGCSLACGLSRDTRAVPPTPDAAHLMGASEMRTAVIAMALLMSGAAIAQTYPTTQASPPDLDVDADVGVQPDGDLDVDADIDVDPATTGTTTGVTSPTTTAGTDTMTSQTMAMAPASGAIVQPGNAHPEHDARGIAVISDPAAVPAGFNGVTTTAVGGPLADPATGEAIAADDTYPACSATVTDNCLQAYERGRSPE